jgi:hypothetical protein
LQQWQAQDAMMCDAQVVLCGQHVDEKMLDLLGTVMLCDRLLVLQIPVMPLRVDCH